MALRQRQSFFSGERRIAHGASPLVSEVEIDVSEGLFARLIAQVNGKDAGSTGNLSIVTQGIVGSFETSVAIDTFVIVATGVTQKIESKLINVRGFDKIKIYVSYANAGADYVDVEIQAGIPWDGKDF